MKADLENSEQHKGWHSRGYVPHYDQPGMVQMVTFRLHDSLPYDKLKSIESEILHQLGARAPRPHVKTHLEKRKAKEKLKRIEAYLDSGYGACYLRDPTISAIVEETILHFDGERYHLLAWVIMPNHVHVLIEMKEGFPLEKIVHSWKSYTAKEANKILSRTGRFWQPDYFDRFIRNQDHLERAVNYIHGNPVKAGLTEDANDWLYSSTKRKVE